MYEKGARGPARPGRLAAYFSGRILDAYRVLFDANEDAHHKALDAAEAQARGAAQSLARCEEHKKAALEQLEVLRAEVVALSGEKMRIEAQQKAALDRARTLEGEGDALRRRADEAHQDLEDARERLESEQTWQAQLQDRLDATIAEHLEAKRHLVARACVEIKFLRCVRAESSPRPPRHRRDACSMAWRGRFLTARPSQDGRAIAEK